MSPAFTHAAASLERPETVEARRIHRLQARFPRQDVDVLAVALALGRASVAVDRLLGKRIRQHGLTPVALQALVGVFLLEGRPFDYAALGRELRVTKANVSWVLTGLESRGLIARERDPDDGRRIRARPTRLGRACIARLIPLAEGCSEEALADLSPAERTELKALVERVTYPR